MKKRYLFFGLLLLGCSLGAMEKGLRSSADEIVSFVKTIPEVLLEADATFERMEKKTNTFSARQSIKREDHVFFVDLIKRYDEAFPLCSLPTKYDLTLQNANWRFCCLVQNKEKDAVLLHIAKVILFMLLHVHGGIALFKERFLSAKNVLLMKSIHEAIERFSFLPMTGNSISNETLPVMVEENAVPLLEMIFMVQAINYYTLLKHIVSKCDTYKKTVFQLVKNQLNGSFYDTCMKFLHAKMVWENDYREALQCWAKAL